MTGSALDVSQADRQPIRRAIRRLRWFVGSFSSQLDEITRETGVVFSLDEQRLADVFMAWLRDFEAQKPRDPRDRKSYVGFAAGLMLRNLMSKKPVAVVSSPVDADKTNPAYYWPEGYAYVAYCLNVRSAVLEQDFDEARATSPEFDEIRTWWSFRENVGEDPNLAIAFLNAFAGDEPDWTMPALFQSSRIAEIAPSFYQARLSDKG